MVWCFLRTSLRSTSQRWTASRPRPRTLNSAKSTLFHIPRILSPARASFAHSSSCSLPMTCRTFHTRLIRFQYTRNSNSGNSRMNSEIYFFFFRMLSRLLGHVLGAVQRSGVLNDRPVLALAAALGLPLGFLGVFTFTFARLETVPITQRRHLVWMSWEEERSLSEAGAREVLMREGARVLPHSHPTSQTVQLIANQLLRALVAHGVLSADHQFNVTVVESAVVNAFVLPGGDIFVYTGILPVAQTYAGLATILGHEIAHALAHHSAEKVGLMQILMLIYEFSHGVSDVDSSLYSVAMQILLVTVLQLLLPASQSRRLELEADVMGLEIAALAGFDPAIGCTVWERMERTQGSMMLPEVFSTHPTCSHRLDTLREEAVRLKQLYSDAVMAIEATSEVEVPEESQKSLPVHGCEKTVKQLEEEDLLYGSADTAHLVSCLMPEDGRQRLLAFADRLRL